MQRGAHQKIRHSRRSIDDNFMYVENLKLVNNALSNFIHGLPVSRTWDLVENTIVADADGQKYQTSYQG